MDSLRVGVIDVHAERPSEMVFVEDDHVIQSLAANASDNTLRGSVLPRASKRCALRVDLEVLDRVVVEDQVAISGHAGRPA